MARDYSNGMSFRKIAEEIREEASRQVRGLPHDIRKQATHGWGHELARQLFGGPPKHRRSRHR